MSFVREEVAPEDWDEIAVLQVKALRQDPLFQLMMRDVFDEDYVAWVKEELQIRGGRRGAINLKMVEESTRCDALFPEYHFKYGTNRLMEENCFFPHHSSAICQDTGGSSYPSYSSGIPIWDQ